PSLFPHIKRHRARHQIAGRLADQRAGVVDRQPPLPGAPALVPLLAGVEAQVALVAVHARRVAPLQPLPERCLAARFLHRSFLSIRRRTSGTRPLPASGGEAEQAPRKRRRLPRSRSRAVSAGVAPPGGPASGARSDRQAAPAISLAGARDEQRPDHILFPASSRTPEHSRSAQEVLLQSSRTTKVRLTSSGAFRIRV